MIKTILFDVDGVLLDSFNANYQFLHRLFTKAGYTPPTKKEYVSLFQSSLIAVIKIVTKSTSQKEIDRIVEMGKDTRFDLYPYELIKTPKHMNEIIQKLHEQYKIGIVTSRLKNFIFDFSALRDVRKYFDCVVSFEDTEQHKPHPDPLLFAIKKLNILPDEIIYVGDQQADLLASRSAGTKIIMLTKESFPDADACVTSFDDIPNAIVSIA